MANKKFFKIKKKQKLPDLRLFVSLRYILNVFLYQNYKHILEVGVLMLDLNFDIVNVIDKLKKIQRFEFL